MSERAEIPPGMVLVTEEPMGFIEALVLFGGLAIILDGIGAVIGRLIGFNLPVLSCLNLFLYIGAGFVAARHTTMANGVWAGIAVVGIDSVFGQLLVAAILPGYRELISGPAAALPTGFLIAFVLAVVLGTLISSLIVGGICGVIGAAISQAGPFRPRYRFPIE